MTLIYFSPVAWDSYEQRPHYFVRDFLDTGDARVIWVNPYPARLPGWRDLMRVDLRQPALHLPRPAALRVIDPRGLPIDPLPAGPRLNQRLFWRAILDELRAEAGAAGTVLGIGRPTALALTALDALDPSWSFYDAMDDFPEFYRGRSREATARIEREITIRVDRIYASSGRLVEKFAAAGLHATLLRNAFDMSLLPPYGAGPAREPHFGFVGCLGGWFDWPLVVRLADAVAPAPVSLVGPLASRTSSRLPPNISIHPPCPQAEATRWLDRFSAGLIPFVRNSLTAGVDPIKFYQYRAAGLPVLSTRFGEMASRGAGDGVFFLDDPGGVAAAVAAARTFHATPEDVARFRAANTWTARFQAAGIWTAG